MNEYLKNHLEPPAVENADQTENLLAKLPEGVADISIPLEDREVTVGGLRYVYRFSEIDPREFLLDRDDNLIQNFADGVPSDEAGKIFRNRLSLGNMIRKQKTGQRS